MNLTLIVTLHINESPIAISLTQTVVVHKSESQIVNLVNSPLKRHPQEEVTLDLNREEVSLDSNCHKTRIVKLKCEIQWQTNELQQPHSITKGTNQLCSSSTWHERKSRQCNHGYESHSLHKLPNIVQMTTNCYKKKLSLKINYTRARSEVRFKIIILYFS